MIRTVATCAGEGSYLTAAQSYAISIAGRFQAHLNAVGFMAPKDRKKPDLNQVREREAQEEAEDLLGWAKQAGVDGQARLHAEGIVDGLLLEANRNDLLVLGLPSIKQKVTSKDPFLMALKKKEAEVLGKARCSVLVVSRPIQPIEKIVVDCADGIESKSALRFAGMLGEVCEATVIVCSRDGDVAVAGQRAAAAESYLTGFDLPDVKTIEQKGVPESELEILDMARDVEADLVVVGGTPVGFLDKLLGKDTAEQVALKTNRPVLIAR